MSRIQACMERLQQQGKKALVPYIVAGDPTPQMTVDMMHRLVDCGADIIELGVPFSDPMAEGPVIQLAHERALAHGVSLRDVLAMVAEFRQRDPQTPVVLMGYANPIEAIGYKPVAELAAQAGVDGLLVVDMPPEEADQFKQALADHALDMIYLIAPTTGVQRMGKIAEKASGYLYYVSLKGVTGSAALDVTAVAEVVAQIKQITSLHICVGFGIKDAESARAVSACAEGVVVGSALVQRAAQAFAQQHDQAALLSACDLVAEMRGAMDAG